MDVLDTSKSSNAKPAKSRGREMLEWAVAIVSAVAVAMLIRAFVFEPYRVDGDSMRETLHDGEMMFTTKFDYLLGEPERFDVVICNYPGRTEHFVKRLVGLPGDTVAVENGRLMVNGEAQREEYITYAPDYVMIPYTLAEGEYFVLGDNRSNSNDSHITGPLSRDQIVSHVRAVYYPFAALRAIR